MDRRIRKTKQALNEALFTLLNRKPFKQITITDIVQEADINRGTFYKHYREKEDLLDNIIQEVLADLKSAYQDPYLQTNHFSVQTLTPSMIKIFDHVYSHQTFYKQVINSTISPSFQNQVCDVIRELVLNDFESFSNTTNAEPMLLATYQAHAIFGMIVFWAEEDFTHSPEYMSEQLLFIIHAKPQIL
ncbi:TetR/AcrR family transcriptional regulator [Listeria seeligeri]|uniref:TetR/AcrR family transcriptional regulator n=1 Tax=Listeria seeligeri TaxID=1640 RepID=UPI0016292F40|nr:TetR/AcrR family transcriptional regulator [Listeria seeligeri]MBC1430627.1 TetR/AcrR family transcriptional regulator [Listeria seeligeri]